MSVDIWIFVAVLFVSCSLVELAIVGHLHRIEKYRSKVQSSESIRRQNLFINLKDTFSVRVILKFFLFVFFKKS